MSLTSSGFHWDTLPQWKRYTSSTLGFHMHTVPMCKYPYARAQWKVMSTSHHTHTLRKKKNSSTPPLKLNISPKSPLSHEESSLVSTLSPFLTLHSVWSWMVVHYQICMPLLAICYLPLPRLWLSRCWGWEGTSFWCMHLHQRQLASGAQMSSSTHWEIPDPLKCRQ